MLKDYLTCYEKNEYKCYVECENCHKIFIVYYTKQLAHEYSPIFPVFKLLPQYCNKCSALPNLNIVEETGYG